jgi:hypothetical protein
MLVKPKMETLTWAEENALGRLQAKELIDRIKGEQAPILLGSTIKTMIERGVYGAVEVGFLHAIAVELMS